MQNLKDIILRQNDLPVTEHKWKDLSRLSEYEVESEVEFKLYLIKHVVGIRS